MSGQRKLLKTVERGTLDEIKKILNDEDSGCNSCTGTACLSQACTMNRTDIVELLLKYGASPNYPRCHSHVVPDHNHISCDLQTERVANSHLQTASTTKENDSDRSSFPNANGVNTAALAVNDNCSHMAPFDNANDVHANGDLDTGQAVNDNSNLFSAPVTVSNDNLHPALLCSNGDHCIFRQSTNASENVIRNSSRGILSFRLLQYPLSVACNTRHINLNIVQQLIDSGASVNAKDASGLTALHIASEIQGKDIVMYLLQHDAQVNSKDDSHRQTPLALACSISNDPQVIELLLTAGSDVNAMDVDGRYPLNEAILNPFIGQEVVQLLLEAGADVTQDYYMSSATTDGTFAIMETLHRHGTVVDPMFFEKSALHFACERTSVSADRVLTLLKWGADVNRMCPFGLKPIEYACQDFQLDKVRVLMGWGADLNLLGSLTSPYWLWHLDWCNQYMALIKLLVAGGLHVDHCLCQTLVSCVSRLPGRKGLRLKVTRFLKTLPENPPTLTHRCRLVLRRCLSPKIDENVERLVMLPTSIRFFLSLKENTRFTNNGLSKPKNDGTKVL